MTTVDLVVKACVCLHNYLGLTENAIYLPTGFVDSESSTGDIRPGDWRTVVAGDQGGLTNARRLAGPNYSVDAKVVRNKFKDYVNSDAGSLAWQIQHVSNPGRVLAQ